MDCPPPLVACDTVALPFDEDPETSSVVTECEGSGRRILASYDRRSTDALRSVVGTVEITNKRTVENTIRFRHAFRVPDGRRPWIEDGSPICFEPATNTVVLLIEATVPPLASVEEVLEYVLPLGDLADINRDGRIDGRDRGILLADWSTDQVRSDLNADGIVNGDDLGILFERWTG